LDLWGYIQGCGRSCIVTAIRSSEIDLRILGWTIGALGEDDALEMPVPGFFYSKLVNRKEFPFYASQKVFGRPSGERQATEHSRTIRSAGHR
jgi:hypothetical protein